MFYEGVEQRLMKLLSTAQLEVLVRLAYVSAKTCRNDGCLKAHEPATVHTLLAYCALLTQADR